MSARRRELHFPGLRESRDGYFVEYSPPGGSTKFASAGLTFPRPTSTKIVSIRMEDEARHWLKRYPIPVMVSAFDEKGDLIHFGPEPLDNHLMAWLRPSDQELEVRWGRVPEEELPDDAYSIEVLKAVFEDLDYRTVEDVRRSATEKTRTQARDMRIGLAFLFFWGAVVPVIVNILGWAHPGIGLAVVVYSVFNAGVHGAKLFGWIRPSQKELARREEERRMHHHHYHCERNPEGFSRLLVENFERDERERIQREAEELSESSKAQRGQSDATDSTSVG